MLNQEGLQYGTEQVLSCECGRSSGWLSEAACWGLEAGESAAEHTACAKHEYHHFAWMSNTIISIWGYTLLSSCAYIVD